MAILFLQTTHIKRQTGFISHSWAGTERSSLTSLIISAIQNGICCNQNLHALKVLEVYFSDLLIAK